MTRRFVSALCSICLLGLAVAAPVAHAVETQRGFLEYSHIEAPTDEPHGSTHDERYCQVCVTLAAFGWPTGNHVVPDASDEVDAFPVGDQSRVPSRDFFTPLGARAPPSHS